ncbi:uncharacterized protein LOC132703566 [Cylas formicarius]|uniref:uncharacterized protein LOC132703566 n=1 Tax=Cylas formicarius TaxID=197179 RepID=UPI00295871BE|nr:uncharacterized protein LOC132703566 [Cylas formicarius]
MEDGLDGPLSNVAVPVGFKNGVVGPAMANSPDGNAADTREDKTTNEPSKVNGENNSDIFSSAFNDSYSSESDALVIDESVPKKKRSKCKIIRKTKEISRRTSEKENDNFSPNSNCKESEVVTQDKVCVPTNNKVEIFEPTKDLECSIPSEIKEDSEVSVSLIDQTPIVLKDNKVSASDDITLVDQELDLKESEEKSKDSEIPVRDNEICTDSDITSKDSEICDDGEVGTKIVGYFDHEQILKNSDVYTEEDTVFSKCNEISDNNVESNGNLNNEVLTHSNPFFNASLFELSQLHHIAEEIPDDFPQKGVEGKSVKRKPKPRLKEYAQYLGLQPAVQFKCSKCGRSGFESFPSLQEHLIRCNSVQSVVERAPENENSCSAFKLTRKVFLCSACGTYYENWNLYMHMLEFHRRYICLYCLGMFSILEDLCQHIQSRHNLEPGVKNSLDEFFSVYNEPCYIICCECNKLFNEQENFFYHSCITARSTARTKPKPIKQLITPENHVTGDSGAVRKDTERNESLSEKEATNNETVESIDSNKNVDSDIENQPTHQQTPDNEEISQIQNDREKTEIMPISENLPQSDLKEIKESIESDHLETSLEICQQKTSKEQLSKCNIENLNDNLDNTISEPMDFEEKVETRKVPKLSLKLPRPSSYPTVEAEDSDGSEKLNMEVENTDNEIEAEQEPVTEEKPQMHIAGPDISVTELELEHPLDKIEIAVLLQKCLKATAANCIYCNHSRRIAVNGKQLGLHAIGEHRYSAIVKSITAEELIPESFVSRIKEGLEEMQNVFFNLDSGLSNEAVTFSHVFECFQCHYTTTVHKELYLHNRKFHSKNLLLCIMCKSNFYSYSELICHLCPGVYVLDYDLQFRCCMCVCDDLPSSFRLMVHLRKKHNVCDVCLEMCHNQYKLSNHVWKHKLHHFCYRCGIAYRNKPDITRHLFWKHGTESVLCKKCLQKKWPHVYHFCVPPTSFVCEDCSITFSRAVSLKVHKRLHSNEKKHACTYEGCTETFISKKLMIKHEKKHWEPTEEENPVAEVNDETEHKESEKTEEEKAKDSLENEEIQKSVKPKVDVYDLPELNLSESDSSDSETDTEKIKEAASNEAEQKLKESVTEPDENKSAQLTEEARPVEEESRQEIVKIGPQETVEEEENSSKVIQNIWDNFKSYQASKEKLDQMFVNQETDKYEDSTSEIPIPHVEVLTMEMALMDHDYCIDPERKQVDQSIIEVKPALESTERVDHDYCFFKREGKEAETSKPEEKFLTDCPQPEAPKSTQKEIISSSSSSSNSDSSSCSCGSNCSCTSSSGSSSSSSDSSDSESSTEQGQKKQQAKRQRRKQKTTNSANEVVKKKETQVQSQSELLGHPPVEAPIAESDLDTSESETDEEFYDRQPQKFAKKILEEKRAQLLAEMGPNMVPNGSFIESTSRPPTPPAGTVEEEEQPKRKKKTKKRKKRKNERKDPVERRTYSATLIMDPPTSKVATPPYYPQYQSVSVAPTTLSLSRNSPNMLQTPPLLSHSSNAHAKPDAVTRQDSTDSNLRASKRRRVPNKFYGYSSDEESEKPAGPSLSKSRKLDVAPASPKLVPPITIKTGSSPLAVSPRPPTVDPITVRLPKASSAPNDYRTQRKSMIPPIRLGPKFSLPHPRYDQGDTGSDSNESDVEESEPAESTREVTKPQQPQLYCYCRCPYDEVSEMIGCDSNECEIEWFHFECVGIMVPPKGQWFCPDCRKKKQQRREIM